MLTYQDMRIEPLRATSEPAIITCMAAAITQRQNFDETLKVLDSTVKFMLQANHTSLFEHTSITFMCRNVSRALLAQLTRHRMASYTVSSQHYQDYRGYPDVMSKEMVNNPHVKALMGHIQETYTYLIDNDGIKPEEARMIFPNSKCCNILWTINARSLINFLNLRLCRRNTEEMHLFATIIYQQAYQWFPQLFTWVGADCAMRGKCSQGKMSCGTPYEAIG